MICDYESFTCRPFIIAIADYSLKKTAEIKKMQEMYKNTFKHVAVKLTHDSCCQKTLDHLQSFQLQKDDLCSLHGIFTETKPFWTPRHLG